MIKIAAHLKNISCVSISELALLHFRALFKYLLLLMHLNLATNIFLVVLELPGQICKLKNILFCQSEQLHLVWKFGEGFASFVLSFHVLLYST